MFGISTGNRARPVFKKSITTIAVSSALLLSSHSAIAADKINGAVSGQVTVQSGADLEGVTVVITHDSIGLTRTTRTNAKGEFNIKGLPIGNYKIVFSKDGFETIEEQRLQIKAGNTSGLEVAMYTSGTVSYTHLTLPTKRIV